MNPISLLEDVSQRDSVGGRIVDVLKDAARLVGEDIHCLEDALITACGDAPGTLNDVCAHILQSGGKHVRPILCLLAYRATGGDGDLPIDLAANCELLHNATLLHDDVIDEGCARRGIPTARIVFSNALSVLGGDYLLIKTMETVAKRGPAFMPPYVRTLNQLVEGELTQLMRRGSIETTESEYFRIIEGKTASLFRWSVYSGALAAGASEGICRAMGRFGWHVGVAFQLMDDILDFTAEETVLGKDLFADIQEGKMTLPVILAAKTSPELRLMLSTLVSGKTDGSISGRIAKYVIRSGILDTVKQHAVDHTQKGLAALRSLSDGETEIFKVIENLAGALLERDF
jgi:octaprenyl-diphosphate synthase